MPDQRNSENWKVTASVAGIALLSVMRVELSQSLLDEITEVLEIPTGPARVVMHTKLQAQAQSYLVARAFSTLHPSPQESMRALTRIADALRDVLTDLEQVSFEHRSVVDLLQPFGPR